MAFKVSVKGVTPAELAARVERVRGREIAETIAEATLDLIQDGFAGSHAPDGSPWEELAVRDGLPLQDTGGLKNSWARGEITDTSAEVVNGKDYADYHQHGTGKYGSRKMAIVPTKAKALKIPGVGFRKSVAGTPARPMVPDGELSAAWLEGYDEAITAYLDGVLSED